MKKTARLIGNLPSGYGHRELKVQVDFDNTYKYITCNMPMTDAINSDDEKESKAAQIDAMQMVLQNNEIDYTDFDFETK